MKPMLAKRYTDPAQRKKVTYPCIVQPKLNGVRALYRDGLLQSRDEKLWHAPVVSHITTPLAALPGGLILDGELYKHGTSLQIINGAISVNRHAPRHDTTSISYHIFDCVFEDQPDLGFYARHQRLLSFILPIPTHTICLVETQVAHDLASAEAYFAKFKASGYEGLMYRHYSAPYGLLDACTNKENRWDILLKRKDWLDDEFTCTDVQEGTGKYQGMVGSLVFTTPWNNAQFTAGSGLSDIQRRTYMDNPPIGLPVTIRYEMLSDQGIPLKPTIQLVHD